MKRALFVAGLTLAMAASVQAQAPKSPAKKPEAAKSKDEPKKYKKVLPEKLVKEAKVTEPQAADAALKAVPGSAIDKMELEKKDGKLFYSYNLKTKGKKGHEEVHIDAATGAVLSSVHQEKKG